MRTGDIVRGVVSPLQRLDNSVVVDIFPIDTLGQLSQRPAHIPHLHLGDQGLVCNAIVAATLEAGKELSELVVVDVDKSGVVTVSMKPLLILSAWQHKAGSKVQLSLEIEGNFSQTPMLVEHRDYLHGFSVMSRLLSTVALE